MAKSIKTNNVQELLKAKGLAKGKKKASEHKPVPRETSRRRLYDLVSEDMDDAATELKPVETTERQLEPVSSIPPIENLDHDLKPVEAIRNQLTPIETTNTQLTPLEATKTPLNPIETSLETSSDLETTQNQLKPVETSKGHLKPFEAIKNRFQPVETSSKGFQVDSLKPVKTIETPFMKPTETGSNWFQNLPSISELHVLFYLKSLNGKGTKKPLIAEHTGLKVAGVKTALNRLKTKGFINLVGFSGGCANSFTVYELTTIAIDFLSSEKANSLLAFGNLKPVSTGFSYSSSINKTTTTEKKEEGERFFIPERLQEFTNSNLFLKYLGPLTFDEIQESIENFSFDFGNGLLPKSENPLRILYGQLKKGETYNSFKRVESEKQMMAEVKKRNEEANAAKVELKREMFKEWKRNNPEMYQQLLSDADSSVRNKETLADAHVMKKWNEIKT